jgi:hypothetical protein
VPLDTAVLQQAGVGTQRYVPSPCYVTSDPHPNQSFQFHRTTAQPLTVSMITAQAVILTSHRLVLAHPTYLVPISAVSSTAAAACNLVGSTTVFKVVSWRSPSTMGLTSTHHTFLTFSQTIMPKLHSSSQGITWVKGESMIRQQGTRRLFSEWSARDTRSGATRGDTRI